MDSKKIIENYIQWIKDNTSISNIDGADACVVSTPFVDRHNDHIEIYIKKNSEGLLLTDDGNTLNDLRMSGVDLDTPKRHKIFQTILNGFGVNVSENDELIAKATLQNIGEKKHYFLQAILAVDEMYTLARENIFSLFKEDVERYFKSNNIIFSKDIKISGKSGINHNIDFIISASPNKPERLIKTISNLRKSYIIEAMFSFQDINQIREEKTENYLIFNNSEKNISEEMTNALSRYSVKPIPWESIADFKNNFVLN